MRRFEVSASTTREGGRGRKGVFWSGVLKFQKLDVSKKEVAVCQKKLGAPGQVRMGFWIGNCATFGNAEGYTGWNSVSRIFVVPKAQA